MPRKIKVTLTPWEFNPASGMIHGQMAEEDNEAPFVADCQDDSTRDCTPQEVANGYLLAAAPELLACVQDVLDANGDLNMMDFRRYRRALRTAAGR